MNMKEFKKAYINNYEYLYNYEGMAPGYQEAIDYFDNSLSNNQKEVLKAFNESRFDFIASDREAAAFVFTLRKFKIK